MKLHSRANIFLVSIFFLFIGSILSSCTNSRVHAFEWKDATHTKELDMKKGYKKKKHRANYHRYKQHHQKKKGR